MEQGSPLVLAAGALLLGAAAGVLLQRSHFCTMGCVSDAALFGSWRRLRTWAIAVAVAIVGSQALDAAGLVDLGRSAYRREGLLWPGALPGGLMFGFGMVLAGGCVSRGLVRLGSGSLKALAALAAAAAAWLAVTTVATPTAAAAPATVPGGPTLPLAAATAGALLLFAARRPGARGAGDLATGFALGALIPLGWLLTAHAGARPDSLNYLAVGRPGFTLPLVAGTLLGALGSALLRREFRLERFTAPGDLRRHLAGGLLMGAGGGLALGCTVGQGLAGASTGSPGSLLALGGALAGGWWGLRYLEFGRLLPPLPAAAARRRRSQLDVADTAE